MLSSVILLGTYLYSTCPSRLSLPLNIYLPSQVLRTNGRFYQTAPASLFCRKIPQQQGYFAPRALPRFLATFNPSYSLLPSTAFPRRVIRPTFFQVFLPGARRVSPVAQCVLVFMPWLAPRQSVPAHWPSGRCSMLPSSHDGGFGLWGYCFWGHICLHFRYGLMTRSPSRRWLYGWASDSRFPSCLPSSLMGFGYYPCKSTSC